MSDPIGEDAAPPANPVAAATHPDPYPFYAELVARRPIHRDGALGLWVASSAEAVSSVLASPACRVRPAAEPVPAALVGSPAGEIFGRLVRMNDGARHGSMKEAVAAALGGLDPGRVATESAAWAETLAERLLATGARGSLQRFAFELPAHVIGSLVGLPTGALEDAAAWTGDFARCLAPPSAPAAAPGSGSGSRDDLVARGGAAAGRLLELFRSVLARGDESTGPGLITALAQAARQVGRSDPDAIVANGVGFLSQAYDATAGLIGNTLVALGREPGALDEVRRSPVRLDDVVQEVLRHDPPVQNTRRFVAADTVVAGQSMRAGDAILVVLAAANRDPAANPEPARFALDRVGRRTFAFGEATHACPGDALAAAIAGAGAAALLSRGVDPRRLAQPVRYRPSANARIPILDLPGAPERTKLTEPARR